MFNIDIITNGYLLTIRKITPGKPAETNVHCFYTIEELTDFLTKTLTEIEEQ